MRQDVPGRIRVGVSGWVYASWRGDFYPEGLVQRRELEYLTSRVDTVEVNGTFYGLQRPATFRRWRNQIGTDVVLALKGGRFVTHLKRLADPEPGLANFFASGVLALGHHLGPVLWQLPSTSAFEAGLLEEFCRALPRTLADAGTLAGRSTLPPERCVRAAETGGPGQAIRHVIEARHGSFASDEAESLLRRHDVALALSDSPRAWPLIEKDTSTFRYVRLHGHTRLYTSSYSPASLDRWATRCLHWADQGQDVYVYFDNDARGHAPHNALALAQRVSTP